MNTGELLDHTRVNVLRDVIRPYIFSDDLVVAFLDEGLKKVAVRTHSFVEATRELQIEAGEDTYALDDDIVFIHSARLAGYAGRLLPVSEFWTPDDSTSQRPTRYTTDKETQSIRFYSAPDQAYTAILRCATLPKTLSLDALDAEISLKPHYQLALADWAAYRCLTLNDVDGRNDDAADRARTRFFEQVNEVKRDVYQLKTGPAQRVHGRRVK